MLFSQDDCFEWGQRIEVGAQISGKDKVGKWYNATVRGIRGSSVHLHFEGWADKWDEHVDSHGDRVAPLGARILSNPPKRKPEKV